MTGEQFKREKKYRAAIALAKKMLENDVISLDDFEKAKEHFIKVFHPVMSV